jgi:putative peptide zinc metalloprotease protein
MREASMLEFMPRRDEDVVIGPRMQSRGRAVYYVKNGKASNFVRLGAREALFLALCDGQRSMRSIAEEMLARADVVMSDSALASLLAMLMIRGLVASPGAPFVGPPKAPRPIVQKRRLGELYVRLGNPDRWLSPVACLPRTVALGIAAAVVLLALAVEGYVFMQFPRLASALHDLIAHPDSGALALAGVFILLSLCAHELAHAAACVYCGGRVEDVGVMFRYMMFFAYCRLDDVVLLRTRARYAVVLAGVVTNIALLAPFVLCDRFCTSSMWLQVSAFLLVSFNASCLLNLLPLMRLDGYLLISVCAGRPDLREEARAAMKNLFKANAAPPRPWGLATFGFIHVVLTILGTSWAVYQWVALSLATRSPVVLALPAVLLLYAVASQRKDVRKA